MAEQNASTPKQQAGGTPAGVAVVSRRAFACLWVGRDVSALGEWILFVALLAWCYSMRESAALLSVLLLALMAPPFLLGPLARSLVGPRHARAVAVAAQLLRAAALVLLLGVKFADDMPDLLAIVLLVSVATTFYRASHDALLPTVVPAGNLPTAERVLSATAATTLVVGGAAGSALFEATDLTGSVAAAITASLVSVLCLLLARAHLVPTAGAEAASTVDPPSLRRGILRALHPPALRTVVAIRLIAALATAGLVIAQVSFMTLGLFVSAEHIGLMIAAQGVGLLAALVIQGRARTRLSPSSLSALALGMLALAEFGFALSASVEAAAGFSAIAGFGLGTLALTLESLVLRLAPSGSQRSVSAGLAWAAEAVGLLSAIAFGPLADSVTPRFALVVASLLLAVLGLYAFGAVTDPVTLSGQGGGRDSESTLSSPGIA